MNLTANRQQLLTILALIVVALWAGDKLLLTNQLTKSWKERNVRIASCTNRLAHGSTHCSNGTVIRERWRPCEPIRSPSWNQRRKAAC